MNNYFFNQKTPKELNKQMADRIRAVRKRRKLTQEKLSEKSGVSLSSLKRFERTGEISLLSFTKLVMALELEDQLESLFEEVPFLSIEEVINGQN